MRLSVIPYLAKKSDVVIHSKILRFYGVGESALETALLPIIDGQSDPTVATYAKEGECAVRISSMRGSVKEAEAAVDAACTHAKELAGEFLYSEEDKEFAQVIVELLKEKGLRLAAAESCTGGLFAGTITSVPGSSDVLDRAFVVYSNERRLTTSACQEKRLTGMAQCRNSALVKWLLGRLRVRARILRFQSRVSRGRAGRHATSQSAPPFSRLPGEAKNVFHAKSIFATADAASTGRYVY